MLEIYSKRSDTSISSVKILENQSKRNTHDNILTETPDKDCPRSARPGLVEGKDCQGRSADRAPTDTKKFLLNSKKIGLDFWEFLVCVDNDTPHTVRIGQFLTCECPDFELHKEPCKHIVCFV
jgi:hypothetical protein